MTQKLKFFTVTAMTGFLLIGCGGGSDSSTTTASATTQTAYLIDSPIDGMDVVCGDTISVTDTNGMLTYDTAKCTQLSFKLGNLTFGSIATASINTDHYITLQELAGKTRNDVTDATVQKMAVLLQSLDDDNNVTNGIKITPTVKNTLGLTGVIADKNDTEISTAITTVGKTKRDTVASLVHLLTYTKQIDSNVTAEFQPSPFRFMNLRDQNQSTIVESNVATYFSQGEGGYSVDGISGNTIPSPITITGGEYSIDGGTWTTDAGLVSVGQIIKVRHTTSETANTAVNTILTIGGVSATFTTTTSALYKVGNIVIDTRTGLQWQDDSAAASTYKNWSNAGLYCSDLTLDGYNDWRLPTRSEQSNLYSMQNEAPYIYAAFKNVANYDYWSSTILTGDYAGQAYWYNYYRAYGANDPQTYGKYVRCVR